MRVKPMGAAPGIHAIAVAASTKLMLISGLRPLSAGTAADRKQPGEGECSQFQR